MSEDRAALFTKMAEAIERNKDGAFGGAFVIVPPEGAAVEVLILDPKQDPAQFWAGIETKAQIEKSEAIHNIKTQQQYPRGR